MEKNAEKSIDVGRYVQPDSKPKAFVNDRETIMG
jgi:hypothetical protein